MGTGAMACTDLAGQSIAGGARCMLRGNPQDFPPNFPCCITKFLDRSIDNIDYVNGIGNELFFTPLHAPITVSRTSSGCRVN